MKALSFFIAVFISIFLIQPDLLAQYGWYQQTNGTTQTLNSISVVNENTIYVCGGSGVILKTTNGGTNWFQQASNFTYNLTDIYFINAQTGWTCGGISNYPNIGQFSVLKTTNGGTNWLIVFNRYSISGNFISSFNSVYFLNSLTGFIGVTTTDGFTSGGFMLYSTNGGINWQQTEPYKSNVGISFLNVSTGFLLSNYWDDTGNDTSYFYKTTNSGTNWNMLSKYSNFGFRECNFLNINTGWIAGTQYNPGINFYGSVFKTTNGGINWNSNIVTGSDEMNSLSFTSSDTGYVCGLGIYRSVNGGLGWSMQQAQVLTYMNKIKMINSKTGWCIGSQGVILKTTTAGIDAIYKISEHVPEKFSLNQNYPNPFNPSTKIRFSIPNSSQYIRIIIYDVRGNKISEPVNKKLDAGIYETQWDASNLSSGVYFYRLVVGDASASSFDPAHDGLSTGFFETKKMILIK